MYIHALRMHEHAQDRVGDIVNSSSMKRNEELRILVLDFDDEPPVFSQSSYAVAVLENLTLVQPPTYVWHSLLWGVARFSACFLLRQRVRERCLREHRAHTHCLQP